MAFSRSVLGQIGPLGVGPERLLGPRTLVLREREDAFSCSAGSLDVRRIESSAVTAALGADLRQPEHRLLAHFVVGVVARRLEQDVLGRRRMSC